MEITKGKWEIWGIAFEGYYVLADSRYIGEFRKKEHSVLAADASNTYQETNKLPSELAEANKELLEALSKFKIAYVDHCIKPSTRLVIEMEGLIKKHSNA